MKVYFLIVNLVFAVVAFSWMVGAQTYTVYSRSSVPSGATNIIETSEKITYELGTASPNIPPTAPNPIESATFVNSAQISGIKGGMFYEVPIEGGLKDIAKVTEIKGDNIFGELRDGRKISWGKDVQTTPVKISQFQKNYWGDLDQYNINIQKSIDPSKYESMGISDITINSDGNMVITETGGTRKIYSPDGTLIQGDAGIGLGGAITDYFTNNLLENLISAVGIGAITAMIGSFAGGKDGAMWGFVSGFGGKVAADIAGAAVGKGKVLGILKPGHFGVVVGTAIFILTYKKESTEIVEFNCQPYQPPIGGKDCELCNIFGECSEYRCKSLGQACELLNAGTEDEKCTWVNPRDVNSPMIKVEHVLEGYKWVPDTAVRPPATGVVISQVDGSCVEAFTALEFTLLTDEPSQCKIDYNLTHNFDEMSYYIGGSNLFSYNHTEEMSLPGPDAINAIAPELQNDGTYTLYARCQDANGNFNQDAFSVRFCVKPGPDTTAPRIEAVNVPSNSPINYEQTELNLEIYVNEPAECKWSKTDTSFDNMENSMVCDTNLWEMNNQNVYTCRTTLTGIQDRKENSYYFKCKDQPNEVEGNRNVNTQSYLYNIVGTQPLNILSIGPNETIRGSTDTIPVLLVVRTDNGYKNGEAICYYSTTNKEDDYIEFLETGGNAHEQRQDLDSGAYTYYYKCVDLGGNTAYDSTSFNVEVDRQAPVVVRAYKSSGELKIITNEKAECAYSNKDCNFDIDEGIQMTTLDNEAHNSEWKTTKNYYIRCKDEYDNQPPLNVGAVGCSIVVRPYEILVNEGVIEL